MKLKKFYITFERRLEVTIIAPESSTTAEVQEIADTLAMDDYELNSWNPDNWEATVGRPVEIEVADDQRRYSKVPGRYSGIMEKLPDDSPLQAVDMALSDDGEDLVNLLDATWYRAPAKEETP